MGTFLRPWSPSQQKCEHGAEDIMETRKIVIMLQIQVSNTKPGPYANCNPDLTLLDHQTDDVKSLRQKLKNLNLFKSNEVL